MKTIKFNWRTPDPRVITVGMETDHNAEDVRFGVPVLEGEYLLLYITAGNYSDVIQLDHGVWHPSRTHTQRPARYEAYIERRKGHDIVWHSEPFAMIVDKLPPTKEKLRQAYPTLVEQVAEMVKQVENFEMAVDHIGINVEVVEPDADGSGTAIIDGEKGLIFTLKVPRGKNGGTVAIHRYKNGG